MSSKESVVKDWFICPVCSRKVRFNTEDTGARCQCKAWYTKNEVEQLTTRYKFRKE